MTVKKDIIEEAIDFLKGIFSGSYECVDEEEHEQIMDKISTLINELDEYWLVKNDEKKIIKNTNKMNLNETLTNEEKKIFLELREIADNINYGLKRTKYDQPDIPNKLYSLHDRFLSILKKRILKETKEVIT